MFGGPAHDAQRQALVRRSLMYSMAAGPWYFLGVLSRDLDLESSFQAMTQLDCVERIRSRIVHKRRIVCDLFLT